MDNHQSNAEQDAVFVRNFALVLVMLTFVGIGAYFLAQHVNAGYRQQADSDQTIKQRLAPVGQLNTSGQPVTAGGDAAAAAAMAAAPTATATPSSPGEATYGKVCVACHGQGIAGAPKFGDAAAWEPRIAQGVETLHKHALEGFQGKSGMMPPKGGAAGESDDNVKAAVDYMVKAAQGGAAKSAPAPAAEAAPAAAAAPVADAGAKGKEIYEGVCFACHQVGAAGAPKFGDKDAWAPRLAQGNDTLYNHAINGFMGKAGMMPPKGGRPDFADADIKAAVDYMAAHAK